MTPTIGIAVFALLVGFLVGFIVGTVLLIRDLARADERYLKLKAKFDECRRQLDDSARATRTQRTKAKGLRRELRTLQTPVPLAHVDGGRRGD